MQRAGPAHAVGSILSFPHQQTLGRGIPLHSRSRRQQVHCTAVVVQEVAQARHVHEKAPKHRQRSDSMFQGASLAGTVTAPAAASVSQQAPSTIEVHLEVQYACQFGQHVSIVGTFQGWHVPAAVPMTWSQGNVWNAVLPVPVGTDIEYKYLVMWDDGNISRWQEGPNNSVSVQHPGVLLHVQDTWSQKDRSVREVGPRLTHNQQQKQSGGHSTGAASPKAAAAAAAAFAAPSTSTATQPGVFAAGAAPLADSTAGVQLPGSSFTTTTSSGSSRLFLQEQQELQVLAAAPLPASSVFAAVLPAQPTWAAAVNQPGLLFGVLDQAAAEDDELHLYEDEEEDQLWPAEMLQKAAAAGGAMAPAAAAGRSTSSPARGAPVSSSKAGINQAKQQQVPAAPQAAATPTTTILAAAAAAAKSGQQKQQQQQSQQAAAAENLAQLLPLLRTELETALAELLKHPEALHEHSSLLEEGQNVLSSLQQQLAGSKPGSTKRGSSAAVAAAAATTGSSASSGSRSPGRSPSSTLTSGDEIAAALLSDDCEEACFCMVDAICSCADWDFDCSCELDPDTPCELSEDEEGLHMPSVQHQQHSTTAHRHTHSKGHSHATAQDLLPANPTGASTGSMDSSSSFGGSTALSVDELARVAAVAAMRDPAMLAARAAAFTDVQAALEKSAELLQALHDPCHPLMIEADRNLATASRQLHAGPLLS